MEERIVILDTPALLDAFVLLQIYHKLKLEVDHPGGMKWRVSPRKQALALMERDGYTCAKNRTKAGVLECYIIYLKDMKGIDPTTKSGRKLA